MNAHDSRASSPECPACGAETSRRWRHRLDDRHCGACGRQRLFFQVGSDPVPDAEEVYLYGRENADRFEIPVCWSERPTGRVAPVIDFGRSEFTCDIGQMMDVEFALSEESSENNGRWRADGWALIQAARARPGAIPLKFPARGVSWTLRLETSAGVERRRVRLFTLSQSTQLVEVMPEGAGNGNADPSTWTVHDRGREATFQVRLKAKVGLWLVGADAAPAGNDPAVSMKPGKPVLLEAGKEYPLSVVVDTYSWKPGQAATFALALRCANLPEATPPVVVAGKVVFSGVPEIVVDRPAITDDLRFGSSKHYPNTLISAEPDAANRPTLLKYEVRGATPGPEWLRVVSPPSNMLPLTIDAQGVELVVEVRGTRADQVLEGTIVLIDRQHREKEIHVRVAVTRPTAGLGQSVALDWGTSNSCASYMGADDEVKTVKLDNRDPQAYPSDLYFLNGADPSRPEFLIGPEAYDRANRRPACGIRSLKRWFRSGKPVTIVDEAGKVTVQNVNELAVHYLYALILEIQSSLPHGIRELGLTFPTKWGGETRARFRDVARRLQDRLADKGRKEQLKIVAPEIDEAMAVAMSFFPDPEEAAALDHAVHLIAYDFGGGTIDTCLLKLDYTPKGDGDWMISSHYLGIGGLDEFGGDEVTRAVVLLIRRQLADNLALLKFDLDDSTGTSVRRIPLDEDPRAGDGGQGGLDRIAHANSQALGRIAGRLKVDLCAKPGETEAVDLGGYLRPQLDKLQCLVQERVYDEKVGRMVMRDRVVGLDAVFDKLGADKAGQVFKKAAVSLADVYDIRMDDVNLMNMGEPFSVREKVQWTIDELGWQCARAGITPHKIILAGGGCRLPLVAALMAEKFSKGNADLIDYDPNFSKRRVSHGMAIHLSSVSAGGDKTKSTGSESVTHHALGLKKIRLAGGYRKEFVPVIKAGSPLDESSRWHDFEFPREQGPPQLKLHTQSFRDGISEFGTADFSRTLDPLPGDAPMSTRECPTSAAGPYKAAVRIARTGPSVRVDVSVKVDDVRYGPYPVIAVGDPLVLLQR